MRQHEWRIEGIEVVRSDVNSDYILKGLLWNTDLRRKARYFAVAVSPGQDTLQSLIERLAGLKKETDLTAAPRPRRNKHPIVDERQMEMFGGDHVEKVVE